MEAKAIERIEQLAAAASDRLPKTHIPAIALPQGTQIHDLEHLLAAPVRMRQTYTTERLADFCRYVKAEAEGGLSDAACFVAPNGSGADAVLDYGTHSAPLWGSHRAELRMRHTAEFTALDEITRRPLTQRDLIDFIEDWAHILTPVRGDDEISLPQALAAIRRVDIKQTKNVGHEQGDWGATRSSMEQIEAKSGDQALPDGFQVRCRVYPHTAERTITARLSLLTGDDTPRLRLRILGREQLMQEIAEEIEQAISTELAGIRVFVGGIATPF